MTEIDIVRVTGVTTRVDAEVFGMFAVHETVGPPRIRRSGAWTVTHVPSGTMMVAIDDRELGNAIAQFLDQSELIPELDEKLFEAWIKANPEVVSDLNEQLREMIQNHG